MGHHNGPSLCFLIPEFWGDIAKDFYWKSKHTGQFLDYNFDVTKGEIYIKCMEGATTNICYNVLDRNVHERKLGDKVAFYWLVCVCVKGITEVVKALSCWPFYGSLLGRGVSLRNNGMEC